MAKSTGLGWTTASITDAGAVLRAIRNDFTNLDFATPRAVQDVTGIDRSAMERLLMLADFSVTLAGVFNNAVNQSHDVFKTVPAQATPRTCTLVVSGSTLTNLVYFTDYKLTRASSGAFTFSVPGVLADGTVPVWT